MVKKKKKELFAKDPLTKYTEDFRRAIEQEKPIKHLYALCEAAFGLYSFDLKVEQNIYEVMGGNSFLEALARESRIFTVKDWLNSHQRTIEQSGITSVEITAIDRAVYRHVRQRRILGLSPYIFIQLCWAGVYTQEQLMDVNPEILRSMIPSAYDREIAGLRRDLLLKRREAPTSDSKQ